jgi:hypothetical protein
VADGIRIQPRLDRLRREGITDVAGRLFILRDITPPVVVAPDQVCHICGRPHECKTYHFQLDNEGTIMVSTRIWERLQGLYDHGGFEKVNVRSDPPTQGLILPSATISLTAKEM